MRNKPQHRLPRLPRNRLSMHNKRLCNSQPVRDAYHQQPAQQHAPQPQQQAYAPRPSVPTQQAPQQQRVPTPPAGTGGHAPFDMRVTQLTTPAQQASADQRRMRRSESLFTRITGFGLVRPSTQQDDLVEEAALRE
jgi:hypothetical protein